LRRFRATPALGLDRAQNFFDTQDWHRTLDVVRQDVKAHLGADSRQRLCQEVGRTHPVFYRSERMFHRLLPQSHHLGLSIEPLATRRSDESLTDMADMILDLHWKARDAVIHFFGSLLLLALAGTTFIDAKRRRSFGEQWSRFTQATSNVPFAAIATGRNELGPALREIGILRPVIATAAYVMVLVLHGDCLARH
jgi:hypothetical protein